MGLVPAFRWGSNREGLVLEGELAVVAEPAVVGAIVEAVDVDVSYPLVVGCYCWSLLLRFTTMVLRSCLSMLLDLLLPSVSWSLAQIVYLANKSKTGSSFSANYASPPSFPK